MKPKQMWAYASSNAGIASWHCGYLKLDELNWTVALDPIGLYHFMGPRMKHPMPMLDGPASNQRIRA